MAACAGNFCHCCHADRFGLAAHVDAGGSKNRIVGLGSSAADFLRLDVRRFLGARIRRNGQLGRLPVDSDSDAARHRGVHADRHRACSGATQFAARRQAVEYRLY